MNGAETGGRTYEQPCPDCGGYLVELGEGARCIDCESIHAPCHDDGCLGFLETKGWNGPKAVLQCGECMATVQLFDRFAPSASTEVVR